MERIPIHREVYALRCKISSCKPTRSQARSRYTRRRTNLFLTREAAEAEFREILEDEPAWLT
jgi:hypothetical protein